MTRPTALIVLAAALAGGCETTNIAPPYGSGDPYLAPHNDPQISVLPAELRPWLLFHPAVIRPAGPGPMEVEVPVRNAAERQYLVEYRILFYDEGGFEQEPVMDWRFASLDPKQTVRLKANAMDEQARSYKIEIRWAR